MQTAAYINGQFCPAASGATFETINPADETTIGLIARCNETDVEAAVAAARSALGSFSQTSLQKRQTLLLNLAKLIREHADELAELEMQDAGKTFFDARKVEIPLCAQIFEYFAGWATKVSGHTYNDSGALKMTIREPIGVCGLITPWNFPLLMATWKVAPALAMGNTVVLKPAEQTPLTALKLAELIEKAGFKPGVFNVVPGFGEEAGAALVRHPNVTKIAFTGSAEVGKFIMRECANTLKRVSLELGGKSPNIIFDDADLKTALRGALSGIFYNKGEVCAAGSRLLVQRSIYDQVLETLGQKASQLTVGPPTSKDTRMGPLASKEQLEKVSRYIELGKKEARLVIGGNAGSALTVPGAQGRGFYVEPTVFADVDPSSQLAQEEIFGPVLAVIPFDDETDAINIANQVEQGLAAGVWTQNIARALRVSKAVKAGTIWVNAYNLYDPALPFGGYKASGFGRDLGEAALEQYTETKSIWMSIGES